MSLSWRRALAWVIAVLALGCGTATGSDAGPDDPVDADGVDAAELDAGDLDADLDASDVDAAELDAAVEGGPEDAAAADAMALDAAVHDAGDLPDAWTGADAGIDAGIEGGRDAGTDGGRDAGIDGGRDAGIDGGRDAGIDGGDRCAGVTCEGDPCRDARCDPATGACVPGAVHADGTRCDDGNACTMDDMCRLGACTAGPAVVCGAIDACHAAGTCDPATGACSSPPTSCATEVTVRVRDARGAALSGRSLVRAFEGWSATAHGGVTDASGQIRLTLPAGSYRFRAMRDGIPTWSGATDHCAMPACTSVEIRVPDATPYLVVTWDPLVDGAYDGMGEIVGANPHITRGGMYLENWGVYRYGRPDAMLASAHSHIFPQAWDMPDPYGNPTEYENQHAFGEMLQGVFVRLETRGAFDLISVDYRTRHDGDVEHVSAIPGADPANVEIWISDRITLPTTAFHRYSTGKPFNAAMTYWGTVFPTELTNVTGVFIATTGNVSIDNVVVRPR